MNIRPSTTNEAYNLIAEGFGPGANGPILVVADTTGERGGQALPQLIETLRFE